MPDAALMAEIAALRAQNAALKASAHQDLPEATNRPKRKLPDLALFSGKRADYLVWAITARQKLERDGASIGTPADQYAYLFARMESSAQNAVAGYFQENLPTNPDPARFLAYLDSVYIDPNAANRALDKLYTLRQRESETFATFFPRFERLLHEARQTDDRTCMATLSRAVDVDIRRAMVSRPTPQNYAELVRELYDVSSKLDQLAYETLGPRRRQQPQQPQQQQQQRSRTRQTDEMDWEPTQIGALAPLTEKERQRLYETGGCYKCRQKGHLARDCTTPSTQAPRRPPAPAPARRTTLRKVRRQPEPDSEEGGDEEEEEEIPAPAPRRRSTRAARSKPKKAVAFEEDSESSGKEYL